MGEGERALLREIRNRASAASRGRRAGLRVGIGDDTAVLALRLGEELVVTTDFSLEGVHFRRTWHAPEAVGHKCLARGLSDIAAMGARPVAAFLSLAVPEEFSHKKPNAGRSWIQRFYDGLLALAERTGVPLAGGDLAQAPGPEARAVADIVVVGAVPRGRALLRSGARAGDALYVTGTLGAAAAELHALERDPERGRNLVQATAGHPHFFPEPRLKTGQQLVARRLATACIDISDGLSVDLLYLCEESGVRAEVDAAALPLGEGAVIEDALHGGDDYELLFTAHPGVVMPRRLGGVPVHRIGTMLRRGGGKPLMALLDAQGRKPLVPRGWQHF